MLLFVLSVVPLRKNPMTKLSEKIELHIKDAMKARNKEKLEVLRFLKSKFIENKTSVSPVKEEDVLIAHVKQLKEGLSFFPKDSETFSKTTQELEVLQIYMPSELTEVDVKKIITEIVEQQEKPQMGLVMKELSPQIKGRFDGKTASVLVQNYLKSL